MRTVGNARSGQLRVALTPLEVCPGRTIWEKHRDREYLIFMDESFYSFFGFADIAGNFCHAALGLPKDKYAQLQVSIRPVVEAYEYEVCGMTGERPRELKSTLLARLPLEFKLNFTRELVRNLVAVGGFVAGFYSTTRGIIMERVRTNLLDETDAVPENHTDLYNAARTQLLAELEGVGQSELIKQLLLLPFSALWNFMNSFNCTFRIRYDPRGKAEDQRVRNMMEGYMEALTRIPDLFGTVNPLLGIETDISSREDIGLQLVDVVAGEVRSFFRRNPEGLNESATLRLITGDSDEPLEGFLEFNNSTHKIGALSPMTIGLATKVSVENSDNLISYYYPVLASGILACITETGQPRLLEIPTRLILDQRE